MALFIVPELLAQFVIRQFFPALHVRPLISAVFLALFKYVIVGKVVLSPSGVSGWRVQHIRSNHCESARSIVHFVFFLGGSEMTLQGYGIRILPNARLTREQLVYEVFKLIMCFIGEEIQSS